MLFQSLDDKNHCLGVYCDGQLIFDEIPPGLTKTWGYSSRLQTDGEVEFAQFYCGGKTLAQVCPEGLKDEWTQIEKRMRSFIRSFLVSGVSLTEHCFYDLVPDKFLMEYCELKNQICEHVFNTYNKPENYDFLVNIASVVSEIEARELNIQPDVLKSQLQKTKVRNFWRKLLNMPSIIKYNMFGTRTGRLTTKKDSFPILTMDKDFRQVLQPHNDYFVELDFNAAELRTLLALSGKDQPEEDLHNWNIENVYSGKTTRDQAKKRIFAWLYNPDSKDYMSARAYDRDGVLQRYFTDGQVTTFFDRRIDADSKHALNYIIQSTTSDLLLKQMLSVNDLLKDKQSFVSFCIHDNLVLDMKEEDCRDIPSIVRAFADTELGKYKVNVRVGKNFGDMKEINHASL